MLVHLTHLSHRKKEISLCKLLMGLIVASVTAVLLMARRSDKITGSCDKKKYHRDTPHAGKIYLQSDQKRNLHHQKKLIDLGWRYIE